ncbi:ferrous iron transport protein A [Planctomycetota bacterium]
MENQQQKPLSRVDQGQTVTIVSIEAGRGLKSRLASMGLLSNTVITIISNKQPGPFVINVKGAKMMLGRGMADKIMVK